MDMIALAMAKAYADSQRLGHTDPGRIIFSELLTSGSGVFEGINLGLVAGKTYTVTFDSGSYEAVCKSYDGDIFYLGNLSIIAEGDESLEDTGESFLVASFFDDGAYGLSVTDLNQGSSVTIKAPETIHPIDPKYLPGVCLPVVELETAVADSGTLTDTDAAKMNALNGEPCLLKFVLSAESINANYAGVAMAASMAGATTYVMNNFLFSQSGHSWTFAIT